jgi:hypothetical protein
MDKKRTAYAKYKALMGYNEIAIPSLRILFRTMAFEGKPSINAKEHIRSQMKIFKKEILNGRP